MTRPDPIIVTGVPRSGVRLVATLLDNHPSLASGPELSFLATMVHQWLDIETTLGENHANHYALPKEQTRENFRAAVLRFFQPRLERTNKKRFVIQSFAASVLLEGFARLFPTAPVVHIVRDPRDVAASMRRCAWRNPRDGQPLQYTWDVMAAARFWSDMNTAALRASEALIARRRFLVLRYEALCSRPAEVLTQLGEFLGETPVEPFVSPESAASVTASLDNPHPPLRVGRVELVRRGSLTPQESAVVSAATVAMRERLGYE